VFAVGYGQTYRVVTNSRLPCCPLHFVIHFGNGPIRFLTVLQSRVLSGLRFYFIPFKALIWVIFDEYWLDKNMYEMTTTFTEPEGPMYIDLLVTSPRDASMAGYRKFHTTHIPSHQMWKANLSLYLTSMTCKPVVCNSSINRLCGHVVSHIRKKHTIMEEPFPVRSEARLYNEDF
jgi:hypothetical protein